MDRIRLFIAIDIDKSGIEKIALLQKELMNELKEVRWTKEDTWHITLKFIGEVTEKKLDEIKAALNGISQLKPFIIETEKVKAFPNIRYPRVIVIETSENMSLKELVGKLEDALAPIGIKKEQRDFRGHITLGRIKDTSKFIKINPSYEKIFQNSISHSFEIKEFHLYKSELGKEGPKYTKIMSVNLSKADGH